MSISEKLCYFFNFLKSYLSRLNLFNTESEDEIIIQNERRTTRLYLILMILSMIIFLLYYSIVFNTQTIEIESPSLEEYNRIKEETSLQCLCTNISIKYGLFVKIEPIYHQLCRSNLVSEEWINHLFDLYNQSWNKSIQIDFRRIGVFQFQTLRHLCQIANDTLTKGLQSFRNTDFIQSQLILPETFEAQIDYLTKGFIDETPKSFLRTLNFMQDITAQSLFMTGASITSVRPIAHYQFEKNSTIPYPGINYTFTDNFTCICSSSTATNCMGLTTFDNDIVPGFQTGCYMLSTLMNSTLEAFHNQTFIDKLSNSSRIFKKLNSSISLWKIEMLLEQMFVESWSNQSIYNKYFHSCAPKSCSYKKTQRYSFWNILLILIGLFNGLSIILRILTPLIIKIWPFLRKKICRPISPTTQTTVNSDTPVPATSIKIKIKRLFRSIKRKFVELNLFQSIPRSTDEFILRQQRHQTRLYLILLLLTLIILTFYATFEPNINSVTIKSPSITTYNELYNKSFLTLDCPCHETTLEYHQFLTDIQVKYHEICSSEFLSSRWLELQFIQSPIRPFFSHDIRYQSQIHFQLLFTLCHRAMQTVNDDLQSLKRTKFITQKVIGRLSFETQLNLIIEQFKRTLPQSYRRTVQLMEGNTDISQLIVPLNSLFERVEDIHNKEIFFRLIPSENTKFILIKCFLFAHNECILNTSISKGDFTKSIPGMIQTRSPLRSVLLSTLECFYNDTCLSLIINEIDSRISPTNFSTLNLSLLGENESQYDRIEILVNKLFIQSFNYQISYESYFNQCHPISCQYTYQNRFDIMHIITTITGLLGGLNFILRLLIPSMIKLSYCIWFKIISRRQNTNRTFAQTISNRTGKAELKSIRSIEKTDQNSCCEYIRVLLRRMKKNIIELNVYPIKSSSQDINIVQRHRRLTRIYLTLVFICLLILVIYTMITKEIITITIKSPSILKYSELYNQYPSTFQCSCSNIAIKYNRFIQQIDPEYHSICSSEFFSLDRYDTLWNDSNEAESIRQDNDDDFRSWIKPQLDMISTMCSLSKNILNSSLSLWLQRDFVTAHVISLIEFDTQIKGLFEEFKTTTGNELILLFKLLQTTNFANQLATTRSSNWKFILNSIYDLRSFTYIQLLNQRFYQNTLYALTLPQTYNANNCSCAFQSTCAKFSSFPYPISNELMRQILPNFLTGCLPVDAILQSDFCCFFNETCLYLLQTSIYYIKSFPVKVLTSLHPSNRTVETILSQLFVEEWNENISFALYYEKCAPEFCQYSYPITFNGIYFLTKTLAIFSGLTKILRYVVSFIAFLVIKLLSWRKKKKTKIRPQSDNDIQSTLPDLPVTTIELNDISDQPEQIVSYSRRDWNKKQEIYIDNGIDNNFDNYNQRICSMTLTYQSDPYSIGRDPKSFIIRDFNGDSYLDLAVTNYDDHTFSILFGNKNGTFQTQEVYPTGNGTYPWGIASADFNNDTFLDIAIALSITKQIAFFFGTASNGSFSRVPHIEVACYNMVDNIYMDNKVRLIEVNDLNNDGFIDLLVICKDPEDDTDSFYNLFNQGNGSAYRSALLYRYFPRNTDSVVFGDFNNDGKQNDLSLCSLEKKVEIFYDINSDDAFTKKPNRYSVSIYGILQSIIRGRFNDDEFNDLALIAPESNTLHVLLNSGNKSFLQQIYHIDNYPVSITQINFNNDSIDDLAILTRNQTVSIYLGSKLGIFFQENIISFQLLLNHTGTCFQSVKAADLNQDGKDDLLFIDPDAQTIGVSLNINCNKHF
ncbi:unnamed protein product [Adineta steineri]|uniref:Uncharacterized protein n=1 Tax=Adineta steineri TaxID=433720 RepID=A0A814ZNA6_9BILA|nr:unnamed protein product [Adineta steineri]CAF3502669.1 unnamed protein product [Adineta steineri]